MFFSPDQTAIAIILTKQLVPAAKAADGFRARPFLVPDERCRLEGVHLHFWTVRE